MIPKYHTLLEILRDYVTEPYSSVCARVLDDYWLLFKTLQGSINNHQAWPGGYHDHIEEVLNIALVLYERLNSLRPLPFSLSDALVVLYFHDIEKPWKYELRPDGRLHHRPEMDSKEAQHAFKIKKMEEYGLRLPEHLEAAIKYTEGELNDYSSRCRVMSPLAAFCHMCDVWSARGWFDHPSIKNDPWKGSRRILELIDWNGS